MRRYEKPRITELGTLHDLTRATNKIGPTPDALTQIAPDVVGSFTPFF